MTFLAGIRAGLLTRPAVIVSGYDADARRAFDAMTVQPSSARKDVINTVFTEAKRRNVWSILDILYLQAAHNEQAGQLNLRSPGEFTLRALNSIPFTVDRGYTGDAQSTYLDTGFNDDIAGRNWQDGSATYGIFSDLATTGRVLGVNSSTASYIAVASGANNYAVRLHQTSGVNLPANSGVVGFVTGTRNGTTLQGHLNGVPSNRATNNFIARTAGSHQIFRSGGGAFGSGRAAATIYSGAMTDEQHTAIYEILRTYLTAVGVP